MPSAGVSGRAGATGSGGSAATAGTTSVSGRSGSSGESFGPAGDGGEPGSSGSPGSGGSAGSSSAEGGSGGVGVAGSAGAAGTLGEPPPLLECGDACTAAGHECVENECRAAPGRMLWQLRIDDRYADYSGGVATDSQGNALYAGSFQVRIPTLGQRLAVHKVTPQGRELWTHTFEASLRNVITAIAVDAEDLVYVSASGSSGAPTLRVIDAAGGLVRETTFDIETFAGIREIAVDADANVILAGYAEVNPPRILVLKKLDRNGDELWSKALHDAGHYYPGYGLAVTRDGNIALATGTSSDIAEAWIGLLDPAGNLLWERTYAGDGTATAAFAILEDPDGELVVGGQVQDGMSFLRRYSMAGELVSHVDLFGAEQEFAALALGPERTIFASGTAYTEGHKLQAWVRQLSPDGTLNWEFFDALDAYPFGRSASELAITPTGDVLVEGGLGFSPGSAGIWAARLAGPNGGVPVTGADDVAPLLVRPYPDHDGSGIFVDPEMPACENGGGNYTLTGEIDGELVSATSATSSNLEPTAYEGGWLNLEWESYIVEGSTIALSGGSIIAPGGHTRAGEILCIQAGELGVLPAILESPESREFKFEITSASFGEDCSGGDATVNLKGCFSRGTEYLPSP